MHMKTHSYRNSFSILVCSFVACWLLGAALVRAGDVIQLKAPPERSWASASISNSFGQPIVSTNRLSLRSEPGERDWAAGYATTFAGPGTNGPSVQKPTLVTRTFKIESQVVYNLGKQAKTNETVSATMQNYFKRNGVDLSSPSSLFYNDRVGVLIVRSTAAKLEEIDRLVVRLIAKGKGPMPPASTPPAP